MWRETVRNYAHLGILAADEEMWRRRRPRRRWRRNGGRAGSFICGVHCESVVSRCSAWTISESTASQTPRRTAMQPETVHVWMQYMSFRVKTNKEENGTVLVDVNVCVLLSISGL